MAGPWRKKNIGKKESALLIPYDDLEEDIKDVISMQSGRYLRFLLGST
jgi:hypothetical protein